MANGVKPRQLYNIPGGNVSAKYCCWDWFTTCHNTDKFIMAEWISPKLLILDRLFSVGANSSKAHFATSVHASSFVLCCSLWLCLYIHLAYARLLCTFVYLLLNDCPLKVHKCNVRKFYFEGHISTTGLLTLLYSTKSAIGAVLLRLL